MTAFLGRKVTISASMLYKFKVKFSSYSYRLIQTVTISEFAYTFFEGTNLAYTTPVLHEKDECNYIVIHMSFLLG